MFTGIIKALGTVVGVAPRRGYATRMTFDAGALDLSRTRDGDSISVNGVCLTVTTVWHQSFSADIGAETLSCTTLGTLHTAQQVNLEPALRAADPLGGHLVSGHVDGIGTLQKREDRPDNTVLSITAPKALMACIAIKGSITVDGVSLTVNTIADSDFEVALIPHTLAVTTLGQLREGQSVNLEIDLIARYLARLFENRNVPSACQER